MSGPSACGSFGSPREAAGTFHYSTGGSVSFLSKVAGSLSGLGVCGSSVMPGPLANSSRVPCLGVVPSRVASLVKEVKGLIVQLNSWTHLTKRHGWSGFGRLAFLAQYCQACAYARVLGFSVAVLPCNPCKLAGNCNIQGQQECLLANVSQGRWWQIVIFDFLDFAPYPWNFKGSSYFLG